MKAYNFMKQKERASFSTFIFTRILPINLGMMTFVMPTLMFFFSLTIEQATTAFICLCMVFVPIQIIGYVVSSAMVSSLENDLKYWRIAGLDKKGRTELFTKVVKYPLKKSIEVYLFFLLGNVIFMDRFRHILNIDLKLTTMGNLLLGLLCYFVMLLIYQVVEKICFEISIELTKQGISETKIKKQKVFGMRNRTRFIVYILIPILMSSILVYIMTISFSSSILLHDGKMAMLAKEMVNRPVYGYLSYNVQIGRVLFVLFFSLTFTIVSVSLFFVRMSSYSTQMSFSLSLIDSIGMAGNDLDIIDTHIFPVDLSSELSYSMYLINRLILMFSDIIKNTGTVNSQINDFMSNLSSTTRETSTTAIQQMSSVEEIFSTIENTGRLAGQIETKVNEMVKITENTISDVEKNNERLNENLNKMREITAINQTTVTGIENLYTQINAVNDIANLINSVASQTKIIAFNAELEMGTLTDESVNFNSVAMEIRVLADKTMNLTKEVSEEIRDIQESGRELILTGQACMGKINEGNALSLELKQKLQNVNSLLKMTTKDAMEVNNFIFEQVTAFNQIKETLHQITGGVKNFTDSSTTITDTVDQLRQESDYLKYMNLTRESDKVVLEVSDDIFDSIVEI